MPVDELSQFQRARTFSSMFAAPSVDEQLTERFLPTLMLGHFFFGEPITVEEIRGLMRDRLLRIKRFRSVIRRQAPNEARTESGRWWKKIGFEEVPVSEIDMSYHVVECHGCTTTKQLDAFQEDLYKESLDPNRPRWRSFIFNGVEHPRQPGVRTNMLLVVVDHALGDGTSMIQSLLSMADDDATNGNGTAPAAKPRRPSTPTTTKRPPVKVGFFRKIGACLGGFCSAVCGAAIPADAPNRLKIVDHRNPTRGKVCALTPKVPLAKVKDIKNRYNGATVNDVLLATMTATIRSYYEEHGEKALNNPKAKVRGSFLVDLRKPGVDVLSEEHFGNRFSTGQFQFPLHFKSHGELVPLVQQQVELIKASPEPSVRAAMAKFLWSASPSSGALADAILDDYGKVTGILSNNAGPQSAIRICGKQVEDLSFYAFASIGLYFGVISYNGSVSASIALDPTCDTDASNLAKHWAPAFEKLYAAAMGQAADKQR